VSFSIFSSSGFPLKIRVSVTPLESNIAVYSEPSDKIVLGIFDKSMGGGGEF